MNYIINKNLISYICSECGNDDKYNGKPLTLYLDHIDGNPVNNVLENLRFLCPNCHSQTDTYAGKKLVDINGVTINNKLMHLENNSPKCVNCNKILSKITKYGLCKKCYCEFKRTIKKTKPKNIIQKDYTKQRNRRKKFDVTREELEYLIKEHPYTKIGEMFGVSDNAIKKRCVSLDIDISNRKFSKKS